MSEDHHGHRSVGLYRGSRQGRGRLGELRRKLPRPAAHRQEPLEPRLPHGRSQAAPGGRRRRRAGHRLLRLGGRHAAAIDAVAARIEAAGTKVARGSRALAGERQVEDLVVPNDPAATRLEILPGAEVTADPFKPGRNISGFRTGPLGMGHVVMHFERIAEVMAFYQNVLEFKVSDYWLRPFPAYFFHVNPRHHSIAF